MIRTGLVGCGSFGKNHLRILKELNPPFVGIHDANPDHGRSMAESSEVAFYPDLDNLFSACDAVVVAVPTIHHYSVASRAMEAGCHVLVEKPITETVEEAHKLTELADRTKRVLAVGHVERHNPVVRHLLTTVTRPKYAVIERLSPFTRRSLDIDVILDLMIHDLQIVVELAGSMPEDIKALGIPVLSPRVDMATAHLTFPSGFMAHITASRVSETRIRKLRVFHGSAYVSVDYAEKTWKGYRLAQSPDGPAIEEEKPVIEMSEPLVSELSDFLEACRTGRKPLVDGVKAGQALELAKTIQEVVQ